MKRICPSCHAVSTSIRCPGCGADTVPADDVRREPASGYSIFEHAQLGRTPHTAPARPTPRLQTAPFLEWKDAVAVVLEVGDQVTFESSTRKGEPEILTGFVVERTPGTDVISVLLATGLTWKMYSSEVLSITRHHVSPAKAESLRRAGWVERPKGGRRG